jgi:hypothetical protein
MSSHPWRCSILALGALTLSLALSSCGKVADRNQLQLDSNTNWLVSCEVDQQCSGSLRCYCGQCTQPCAQNDQCGLLSGAVCAESGEAVCGQQASPGGLCVLECTRNEECGSSFSCNAGQCVPVPAALPPPNACNSGVFRTLDEIYSLVVNDLSEQDIDDQPFLRYVSLGDRYLESDCSSAVTAQRQGLNKLLNSLSLYSIIGQPIAVDVEERLYRIDLRDYAWNRPISFEGTNFSDAWEVLVASNPYAIPFVGDDADDAVNDTGTLVPVMFASSLIAYGSQPEVYYALLEIPEDLSQLWLDLGIDRTTLPYLEAGFVDDREFLAQQWQIEVRAGYVWQISEFGREPGALFGNPLAPPLGEQELIFTLPNGLHAFAFSDSTGRRLPSWQNGSDLAEPNGAASVPRSNLRRHPLGINVRDEVLDYVLANPGAFTPDVELLLRQRFVGASAVAGILQRDYEALTLPALRRAGIDPLLNEPITSAASDFGQPLTLDRAASELLVLPEELRQNLDLLDPAMAVLDAGQVDRSDFTQLYRQSMCTLGLVLENQPAPEECE